MNEELNNYYHELIQDVQMARGEYPTNEMAFTATILDKISEFLDCKDIVIEHCQLTKANGDNAGEIHAYGISTNEEVLYLFYTDYCYNSEIQYKSSSNAQSDLNRPQSFYKSALRYEHANMDSSSPEYRALKFIYDNNHSFSSVQLVILSNYMIKNLILKKISIQHKNVYLDVWDFNKLFVNMNSMTDHVAIDIDFSTEEYKNYKIPFIQMESEKFGYKCIQAMFPAKLLYRLYDKYNTKLLFSNVRYFLGVTGDRKKKPNVAMLTTLREENEKFLAYNNGITALAQEIDCDSISGKTDITDPDNKESHQYISTGILKKICDFRIINGGQTTAVLYKAKKLGEESKDLSKKVNLLGVYVQVKLIICDKMEQFAGKIVSSTNFQNQVKYKDLTAGNTFNKELEKLSKTIGWTDNKNEKLYWFYERLHGQYGIERKMNNTGIEQKLFDAKNSIKRKFTKEEVSKIWMCWKLRPHDAVKGSGTTYMSFMSEYEKEVPSEDFYKQTIGLLILYRFLSTRPENSIYKNAKATVVAYTLAMLARDSNSLYDLKKIWDNQSISANSKVYLNNMCSKVYSILKNKSDVGGTTILSYGKSKVCLENLLKSDLGIDIHLLDDDLEQL